MKHAQRIDQPAIKEDPLGSARLMEVLFNVSTKNLLSESKSIGSPTRAARKAFSDDGPRRLFDGCVAPGGKLSQERRLARTQPAGDDDVTHRYLESTTANGLASAAAFESRAQWSCLSNFAEATAFRPCPASPLAPRPARPPARAAARARKPQLRPAGALEGPQMSGCALDPRFSRADVSPFAKRPSSP